MNKKQTLALTLLIALAPFALRAATNLYPAPPYPFYWDPASSNATNTGGNGTWTHTDATWYSPGNTTLAVPAQRAAITPAANGELIYTENSTSSPSSHPYDLIFNNTGTITLAFEKLTTSAVATNTYAYSTLRFLGNYTLQSNIAAPSGTTIGTGNAIFTINVAPGKTLDVGGNSSGTITLESASNLSTGPTFAFDGGGTINLNNNARLRNSSGNGRITIANATILNFNPGSSFNNTAAGSDYTGTPTRLVIESGTVNINGGNITAAAGPASYTSNRAQGILIGNTTNLTATPAVLNINNGTVKAIGAPGNYSNPSPNLAPAYDNGISFGSFSASMLGGTLNLNGGTLVTTNINSRSTTDGASQTAILNFNGGTLKITTERPPSVSDSSAIAPIYQTRLDRFISSSQFRNDDTSHLTISANGAFIDTSLIDTATNPYTGNPRTNGIATISTSIRGTGNLTKLGANTLKLSADNTYTGQTILLEGNLIIGNTTLNTQATTLLTAHPDTTLTTNNTTLQDITLLGNSTLEIITTTTAAHLTLDPGSTLTLNLSRYTTDPILNLSALTQATPSAPIQINISKLPATGIIPLIQFPSPTQLHPSDFNITNLPENMLWTFDGQTLLAGTLITPLPPEIITQPADTLTLNENATLTLNTTLTATGPITYQWHKDDQPITNNPTALTPTLIITDLQPSDAGTYTLTATNSAGTATTNPTTLAITQLNPETTWNNPSTGDWSAPDNWTNGTPIYSNNATIDTGTSILSGDTRAQTLSLNLSSTLRITQNATLTLNTLNLSPTGTITLNLSRTPETPPLQITQNANLTGTITINITQLPAADTTRTIPLIQLPDGTSTASLRLTTIYPPNTITPGQLTWTNGTLTITLPPAPGTSTTWTDNTTGDWHNPDNWTNGTPTANTDTYTDNGNITLSNDTARAGNLTLANNILTETNLTITGNNTILAIETELIVANYGTANLTLSNNATLTTQAAILGRHAIQESGDWGDIMICVSEANLTLADPGTTWANSGNLYIGYYGFATLNIANGAQLTTNRTYVGTYNSTDPYAPLIISSAAEIHLTGNNTRWTGTQLYLGYNAHANLTLSQNSTLTNTGAFCAAYAGNSTATIHNDGTINTGTTAPSQFARNGTAEIYNNGTITAGHHLFIADSSTATATLINNGTLSATRDLTLSLNGTSTTINNGTLSASTLYLARNANSTATLLNNGNITTTDSYSLFANNGTAHITNTGNITTNDNAYYAFSPDSNLTLVNTGNITSYDFAYFGCNGTARIENSGTIISHAIFATHFAANETARVTLINDGTISGNSSLSIGANGTISTTNTGNISAKSLNIAIDGTSTLANDGTLSSDMDLYTSFLETATSTITNNGTITSKAGYYLAFAGTSTLINNGRISGPGSTYISYHPTGNSTLINNGTLTIGNQLHLACNGTSTLIINPNSTLTAKTLNASANSTLHFNLTHASNSTIAPIQSTQTAPTLLGTLTIDTTQLTANSTYPLLQTIPQTTPAIPAHTLIQTPGTSSTLSWSPDGSTLQLAFSLTPPINPANLTPDQLLLYALTNTTDPTQYTGTTTHLPTTTITNNTLQLTFTPTRQNLTYEIQQSLDLQTWTTIQTLAPAQITNTPITINSTNSTLTTPQQFLRLKITPPQQ